MKSKWIEYNGKKILYQDYSNYFFNEDAVKTGTCGSTSHCFE